MMMTDVQPEPSITVRELGRLRAAGRAGELLDVRTPPEYAAAHIAGSKLLPLDQLKPEAYLRKRGPGDGPLYLLCQSGARSLRAFEEFRRIGFHGCVQVEGGLQAWMDAGLPVDRGESRVLPLMRQVQITVGIVSALGAALALAVDPWFAGIPLVTGLGLLFAGLTGHCGMAMVLARMPWNRVTVCPTASCGEIKS